MSHGKKTHHLLRATDLIQYASYLCAYCSFFLYHQNISSMRKEIFVSIFHCCNASTQARAQCIVGAQQIFNEWVLPCLSVLTELSSSWPFFCLLYILSSFSPAHLFLLVPAPGKLYPQVITWWTWACYSGLYSNIKAQRALPWSPHPTWPSLSARVPLYHVALI